jgi:hypothetical protein
MNPTQKKFLIAAVVAIAVFHFAPSFINSSSRAAFIRQQQAAQAARQTAARPASPLPASDAASADTAAIHGIPTQFDSLTGIWQGAGPLPGQDMCSLRLELRKSPTDPGRFAGFPILACRPVMTPFTRPSPAQLQNTLSAWMTPMTAVLSGAPQNGVIQFTVDKAIGKTPSGCAMTSFTVTPFGSDMISAEWQEGQCPAGDQRGQILLRRMGK